MKFDNFIRVKEESKITSSNSDKIALQPRYSKWKRAMMLVFYKALNWKRETERKKALCTINSWLVGAVYLF